MSRRRAITERGGEKRFSLDYWYETDSNYAFIRKESEKDPVILRDREFGSVIEERQKAY